MKITHCTLTGVDERTELAQLADISNAHPIVEWGFLYSPNRQGEPGRYPPVSFLRKAFAELAPSVKVALHICGAGVAQLIDGEPVVSDLVQLIGKRGGRVQLNFHASSLEKKTTMAQLRACIARHPDVEFITQHNPANAAVWGQIKGEPNHSLLFDESGGQGILATAWAAPLDGIRCGYAGGLGPANVATEIMKIRAAAGAAPFWIDMEGKLRDPDDWFDLNEAKAVLQALGQALVQAVQAMPQPTGNGPKIYPVIHYIDRGTALSEAQKADEAGADGIFLISHHGEDMELLTVACALRVKYPHMKVGVNFLSMNGLDAVTMAREFELPMLWGDDVGVDSTGLNCTGRGVQAQKVLAGGTHKLEVFASVAFKYRPHEPNPALAAKNALAAGFIPTTSGSGTGSAPELNKIIAMSKATGGILAVASGMTPENIGIFAPYLSHVLVATGIGLDEYRMDVAKLKALIANSRAQNTSAASARCVCGSCGAVHEPGQNTLCEI